MKPFCESKKGENMGPAAKLSGEMSRHEFVRAVGLGAASLALPGCAGSTNPTGGGASSDRPNIIFIMADDLGCFPSAEVAQVSASG